MGNRANVVIVENHDWQLYYSHWGGCRMVDALVAGPEFAQRYVDSLRRCAKNEWTDPLWADGGLLIDLDRRRILLFGDQCMVEMSERRAIMTALHAVWPEYEIGWAYDGTMELAVYVGAELPELKWDKSFKPKLVRDRKSLCQLVSVVDGHEQLRMWPLWWGTSSAWLGPELLMRLPGRGVTRLALGMIPEGGVHIDVPRKTMGAWQTADTMGIFQALPELWSDWQTECWNDDYDEQLRRCDSINRGALRLPALDEVAGIDIAQEHIRARVFQRFSDSPAGRILALADELSGLAPGMEVSADAILDCGVRPRHTEWARFVAACDAVRGRQQKSA